MKKFGFLLSLIIVMVLIGSLSVSAANLSTGEVTDAQKLTILKDDGSNAKIQGACPFGNGVCQAVAHGTGFVYIDGKLEFVGMAWQCKNCNTVYVTEYDPILFGGYAGKFVSIPAAYEISGNGVVVYVSSYQTISNVNTQLSGINFIYY